VVLEQAFRAAGRAAMYESVSARHEIDREEGFPAYLVTATPVGHQAVPLSVYGYWAEEAWDGGKPASILFTQFLERRDNALDVASIIDTEAIGASVFERVLAGDPPEGLPMHWRQKGPLRSYVTVRVYAVPRSAPLPEVFVVGPGATSLESELQQRFLESAVLLWQDDGGPWRTSTIDAFLAQLQAGDPAHAVGAGVPREAERWADRLCAADMKLVAFGCGPHSSKFDPDGKMLFDGAEDIGKWVGSSSGDGHSAASQPQADVCDAWLSAGGGGGGPELGAPSQADVASMVQRLLVTQPQAEPLAAADSDLECGASDGTFGSLSSSLTLTPRSIAALRLKAEQAWQAAAAFIQAVVAANVSETQPAQGGDTTTNSSFPGGPESHFVRSIIRSSTTADFKMALSPDDLRLLVGEP
jgi:hypothetical protein